jgi:hypothetical protein
MTVSAVPDADVRVSAVRHAGPEYVVAVTWAGTGATDEVDLAPLVFRYRALRPLRDLALFHRVEVAQFGYGLAWPGDADLEVGPGQLQDLIAGQKCAGMRPS